MIQPDFNNVFFVCSFFFFWWGGVGVVGRGSICSYQYFQELYLETRHGKVHFSQHFCSRLNVMYSLSQNCWDTYLSSYPPNAGVQHLVS